MPDVRLPEFQMPNFLNPAQLAQIKNQMYAQQLQQLQLQEAQQGIESKNALKQIMQDPSSRDESGLPNKNAIGKIMAINPEMGMTLQNNMLKMQQEQQAAETQKIHQALFKMEISDKQASKLEEAAAGFQGQYDDLIKSGHSQAQAAKLVTDDRTKWLDEQSKSGAFEPGKLDKFKGPFNPEGNLAFIRATPAYKTYYAEKKAEATEKRQEAANTERERHDRESERRMAEIAANATRADNSMSNYKNWSEQEKDAFAKEASKDRTMLANIGRGRQGSANVMDINRRIIDQQLKEGGPGAATRRKEFTADSTSLTKLTQTSDAIESFENTALANGKVLVDLAKKVDKTGVPIIERWIRAGRKDVKGDPDVSEFDAQIRLFGNEAAKILSNPSMTGVLSDKSREEVNGFLPEKASAAQIERVVGRLEKDFVNRKKSVTDQMGKIQGRMESGYGSKSKADDSTSGGTNHPEDVKSLLDKYK